MTTVTLKLPEGLETYGAAQAVAGGHASVSDYILSLIRENQRAREQAVLEERLLAGVESLDRGEGRPMQTEDWERLRGRLDRRITR